MEEIDSASERMERALAVGAVSIRFFLGTPMQALLRQQLKESHLWQTDRLLTMAEGIEGRVSSTGLTSPELVSCETPLIVPYQGKEYLALRCLCCEASPPVMAQLRVWQECFRRSLHYYCPDYGAIDRLPLYFFAQVFLS